MSNAAPTSLFRCIFVQTFRLPLPSSPGPPPPPFPRLSNSGKPRDQKSALRVSGGAAREDGGSRVGRGSKGDEGEGGKGKVKERSSSFGGVVNKLLCLQDFVSLELLRVRHPPMC